MDKGVAILILAAGASTRMGGIDKLLQKVDNRPILRRTASIAVDTGCATYVVLPQHSHGRLAALAGLPLTQLEVEQADQGMSDSLRAGVAILPANHSAVMVVLADMPDVTGDDLARMIQQTKTTPNQVVRAMDTDGTPGHPVILPRRLFAKIAGLEGDSGAKPVLVGEDIAWVDLPDQHATMDLDTPEQWLAWRKANPFRN